MGVIPLEEFKAIQINMSEEGRTRHVQMILRMRAGPLIIPFTYDLL